MKVAEVILVQQGQAARGVQVRVEERLPAGLGPLDDPDAGQPSDLRPPALLGGPQQDRDLLAVPGGEFLGHPQGQRAAAAQDDVVAPATLAQGGGHPAILWGIAYLSP